MYNFFCMSQHEDDMILSAHIVSALAKKTNTPHCLYVKSEPEFKNMYPSVQFILVNDIPVLKKLSRKPIHQDVVDGGEDLYINVWVKQQRNLFLNKAKGDIFEASRLVANNCIKLLGLRKRINKADLLNFFNVSLKLKIKDPYSLSGLLVAIIDGCHFKDEMSTIASAMSTIGFYVDSDKNLDNLVQIKGYEKTCLAISRSDIVVCKEQILLLPYFQFAKNKKIFLVEEPTTKKIFENVTVVSGVNDLINSLMASTQAET